MSFTYQGLAKSPLAVRALSEMLALVPENKEAWTYVIRGFDGTPYITRTLLPRVDGLRVVIHHIHRPDYDQWMHNHPWKTARFTVVSGGYVEERLIDRQHPQKILRRSILEGDENVLDADTFHRVVEVRPDTWTVGLLGERVQDWGFLVEGRVFVEAREYFNRNGYSQPEGGKS